MGKKRNKHLRHLKEELAFYRDSAMGVDEHSMQLSAKERSKKAKKKRRRERNEQQRQTLSKDQKWYLVKVYDTAKPTKEFLLDSFASSVDTKFTMHGYHHSVSSVRFYIENNQALIEALRALDRRMQGPDGQLMNISIEPCKNFLLLNSSQLNVVKMVLGQRYNTESHALDLSNFHQDSFLIANNVLVPLSDPTIMRQVMVTIRETMPSVKIISLSHNSLKLNSIRVVAGAMGTNIVALNLECNEIENLRELLNVVGTLPLTELKLEGNNCLKDIKDPILYIKMARTRLPYLVTLDGVDVKQYLERKVSVFSDPSQPSTSSASPNSIVTEFNVRQFLYQFYTCFDSSRLQLKHAFLPSASCSVKSCVPGIVSSYSVGHEEICTALSSLPQSRLVHESMNAVNESLSASEARVEVSCKVEFAGHEGVRMFKNSLFIVPYNSGLGCQEFLLLIEPMSS